MLDMNSRSKDKLNYYSNLRLHTALQACFIGRDRWAGAGDDALKFAHLINHIL
jgi:hypothetical protein